MKKKKILFTIWSYTYGGGAERILSNLMNAMNPKKYEIDVLEYRHSAIKCEKTNPNIHILPPVIDETKDSMLKRFVYEKLVFHKPDYLRKKYIKKEYDYEIAFNYMIPSFLLTQEGKSIAWTHCSFIENDFSEKLIAKQRKYFEHVENIITISDVSRESYLRTFPEYKDKMVMIRNGYDFLDMEAKLKEKVNFQPKRFSLVTIARLVSGKGLLRLLNVLKILRDDHYDVELNIIGEGPVRSNLEEFIKSNHLNEYVNLLGFCDNPYPYVSKCDVFILLSEAEGFPTVYVEALYLGKPIISSIVGGSKELTGEGKYGFEVETDQEAAQKVISLLNDKKLYQKMSKSGKEFVKQFSTSNQVKELERLLK